VIWPHVYDPLGSPLASTLVATLPPVALGAVGTPIITLAKVTRGRGLHDGILRQRDRRLESSHFRLVEANRSATRCPPASAGGFYHTGRTASDKKPRVEAPGGGPGGGPGTPREGRHLGHQHTQLPPLHSHFLNTKNRSRRGYPSGCGVCFDLLPA